MKYDQPVVIHLACCKKDKKAAAHLIDALYEAFSRNASLPFSRELNVPVFVWCDDDLATRILAGKCGQKNVLIAFTSAVSCMEKKWVFTLNTLNKKGTIVVPVALDSSGMMIGGRVGVNNVIPYFKWKSYASEMLVLFAAQAICQHCFNAHIRTRTVKPMTVFLSHTKRDRLGECIVKDFRRFIGSETTLDKFLDINDIQAGEPFDNKILRSTSGSVFLAVVTDSYSTRCWCQKEAIEAKRSGCSLVVLDCVEHSVDRILPALSNVPCVRPVIKCGLGNHVLSDVELAKILKVLMIESLRCLYVRAQLEAYKKAGFIHSKARFCVRPPELADLRVFKGEVLYPEPAVINEEWNAAYRGRCVHTPFLHPSDKASLRGVRIGISVSDPEEEYLCEHGIRIETLKRLAQDFVRVFMPRGATLLYGGDLRPRDKYGFSAFLWDEAKLARQRIKSRVPMARNYLAWPLYLPSHIDNEFRSQYVNVVDWVEVPAPKDVCAMDGFSKEEDSMPDGPMRSYVLSQCLTAMRKRVMKQSDARICVGGKFTGYSGQFPGVLEEILLAIERKVPIFLLGGFGGVVSAVSSSILNGKIDVRLTQKWQEENSPGCFGLLQYANSHKHRIDYARVRSLCCHSISELAKNAGLTRTEYRYLMTCPYCDECLFLLLKGLAKISGK